MKTTALPPATAARADIPAARGRCPWPRRGQAGFTLIEVLVTATIVSILAAVSLPKFLSTLDKAKLAKAVAEITIIRDAVENHRALHNGALPADMAELIPDSLGNPPLDPWARPYVFNNFTTIPPADRRVDEYGALINNEYDIYSMGANGHTEPIIHHGTSNDDIIMGRNGGFVGPSKEY